MGESAADDAIELRVGEERTVRLAGLGTAGYRWVPQVEGDPGVAEVRPAEIEAAAGESAVGASDDEAFTIRANQPGVAHIRLAQRRPWEPDDVAPADVHTIRLRVT